VSFKKCIILHTYNKYFKKFIIYLEDTKIYLKDIIIYVSDFKSSTKNYIKNEKNKLLRLKILHNNDWSNILN